jgi:hypothetical protein
MITINRNSVMVGIMVTPFVRLDSEKLDLIINIKDELKLLFEVEDFTTILITKDKKIMSMFRGRSYKKEYSELSENLQLLLDNIIEKFNEQ